MSPGSRHLSMRELGNLSTGVTSGGRRVEEEQGILNVRLLVYREVGRTLYTTRGTYTEGPSLGRGRT